MKLLFMGTPDIAADSLAALIAAGHTVCGVFTREDKPVGRKQVLTPPPVKQLALAHNIPVYQPKSLKNDEAKQSVQSLAPELIVVVAYGRILPPEILQLPPYGCINLHVSLLPRYRGAAPIQHAVLNGDDQTGVTIMYMDEGLDTGDIITTMPVAIGADETAGEVFDHVSALGAKTLVDTIEQIARGTAVRTPQDHTKATFAPPLSKEMALFDFSAAADSLHHVICGLSPWPVAYFMLEGKKVKVTRSHLSEQTGRPGEVLRTKPLTIACGSGAIELIEVVPEGKRPMQGFEWAAGRRLKPGDLLCSL